ncbi:hypothetical protein L596_023603 [Steinernema carpocapsae]|uniref:Uncharacterized protein n=1 Tax=Steinernema carpocapsae TaxID=34508 RepID=A0A4U5MEX6_STECR|nr:hypothetical protein L596_023603 [Steinernema carpocapsae]
MTFRNLNHSSFFYVSKLINKFDNNPIRKVLQLAKKFTRLNIFDMPSKCHNAYELFKAVLESLVSVPKHFSDTSEFVTEQMRFGAFFEVYLSDVIFDRPPMSSLTGPTCWKHF